MHKSMRTSLSPARTHPSGYPVSVPRHHAKIQPSDKSRLQDTGRRLQQRKIAFSTCLAAHNNSSNNSSNNNNSSTMLSCAGSTLIVPNTEYSPLHA